MAKGQAKKNFSIGRGKPCPDELDRGHKGKPRQDASEYLVEKGAFLEFYRAGSGTPGESVCYKAFLTQYEDQYQSDWDSQDVYGRMDPIQTFKGTKRSISLGWDVVAASLSEAIHNLRKTQLLIRMLYPQYGSVGGGATTIGAAPLFRLKFGNLISSPLPVSGPPPAGGGARLSGLLGTVSGFTYAPDIEQGFFDVDTNGTLYPQTIKLSCTFTVLHTHELGWRRGAGESEWDNFPYAESAAGCGQPVESFQEVKKRKAPARRTGAKKKVPKVDPQTQQPVTDPNGNQVTDTKPAAPPQVIQAQSFTVTGGDRSNLTPSQQRTMNKLDDARAKMRARAARRGSGS